MVRHVFKTLYGPYFAMRVLCFAAKLRWLCWLLFLWLLMCWCGVLCCCVAVLLCCSAALSCQQPPCAASCHLKTLPFSPFKRVECCHFLKFYVFPALCENLEFLPPRAPPPSLHLFLFPFWIFAKSLLSPKGVPSAATWQKFKKGKGKDLGPQNYGPYFAMRVLCFAASP